MYRSSSPNSARAISVEFRERSPLPSAGYEVALLRDSNRTVIYHNEGSDVYPCFAEVGWSPDSKTVGILIRDCWHSVVHLSFDASTGKRLDPSVTRSYVENSLRAHYTLAGRDPVTWAESEEARQSFQIGKMN